MGSELGEQDASYENISEVDVDVVTYIPAQESDMKPMEDEPTPNNPAENNSGMESNEDITISRRYPNRERTNTVRFAPGTATVATTGIPFEPATVKEALQSEHAEQWCEAIHTV